MPQALASDMARRSLDALLERIEGRCDLVADEVRELLAGCEIVAFTLERAWHLFQGFLNRGMERKQLTFFLKELLDVVALGLTAYHSARDKVKDAADLSQQENAEVVSRFEQWHQRATEMHSELTVLLLWLETPPQEIDPSALPTGRGEHQSAGYVGLDELTQDLNLDVGTAR